MSPGCAMALAPRDAGDAVRRRKRQGSETRSMSRTLQVRFSPAKLRRLEAVAGRSLPALIRLYGDLLCELLPVAEQRGVDPVEVIRETVGSWFAASESLSA